MSKIVIIPSADLTFEAPVRLTVHGKPEPVEVRMLFRHKSLEAATAWRSSEFPSLAAQFNEIIAGWSEEDFDKPYSVDALAEFFGNYGAAPGEVATAYAKALMESRVKN
ncbi:MAG: Phage tail assembly chaperone [Rhodocyclaceae bacterium]|nr:Phage tail assembly chaperone [Rhodocyclaceae bacterium]